MNHNNLISFCNAFELGTPLGPPKRVYGGLLHTMWCVETDKASYAVKQLSSHIDLTNEYIVKNYDVTEDIASRFLKLGVPAVCAIIQASKYLTVIDGTGFLVYPWVDAKPLRHDTISEFHAIKIAEVLAKMHLIHLSVPEIEEPVFCFHTNKELLELIDKAEQYRCSFSNDLRQNQDAIFAINDAYQNASLVLKSESVVSHGDLDQKNVLWDKKGNPILIDWESACKLNPTYDIINTAFYWSGITSEDFNPTLFVDMIKAYQRVGGVIKKNHLEAACYGTFGWINWMVYNIERACTADDSEQKTLGIEQVNQVIRTMIRLRNSIPDVLLALSKRIESL